MGKIRVVYALALFAGLGAAAISWFEMAFPYLPDSDSYIEQARSFVARGVFEVTPWSTDHPDKVYVPEKAFPPGYPLLIAISSLLLQQPIEVIAPYLSLVALLLLPIAIVFSFHRIIGPWPSLLIGTFVALTPAAIEYGYFAYSDLISLILVIFSVNRLLVADNKASSWFCLGLLTGFSYVLRNANIALLISMSLYLVWTLIIEPENRKLKIFHIEFWLLGNGVFLVPMFIYNLVIFGKLQPYVMPPSTLGLGENIDDYIFSQLDTLLGFGSLGHLLTNHLFVISVLLCMMVMLIRQAVSTWQQWPKNDQKTFVISTVYTVIGVAITIAARTKYQWGVHICTRYVLPYVCFIFVALVIFFKNNAPKIHNRYLIPGIVVTLLVARMAGIHQLHEARHEGPYSKELQAVTKAADQMKNNPDTLCKNLEGRFAMSNFHYVYRIVCAVPVRQVIPLFSNNKLIDKSLKILTDLGAKKGVIISFFSFGDQDNLPLQQADLIKLNSLGWQIERNDKENLIMTHKSASIL